MTFPKKLHLVAWAPVLEREGDQLELELEAFKETKRGQAASWRGKVRLQVDRVFVRQIAQAIEQMQKRDRERLAREHQRLADEVAPVQIIKPKEHT